VVPRAHAREAKLKFGDLSREFTFRRQASKYPISEFGKYLEKCQDAGNCSQAPQHKLKKMAANNTAPSGATDAVLKPSDPVPEGAMPVKGLDFNDFKDRNITVAELVENMAQMGFQASSIGQAAKIVDGMVCTDVYLP
jgi:deoxyhypusine synthase